MTTQHIFYLVCTLFTGLLGLIIGLLSYFGKKFVAQQEESQKNITLLTNSLYTNSEETKKLRTEMSTLLRAFNAFDRWVYGEAQHGSFKTNPPDFSGDAHL